MKSKVVLGILLALLPTSMLMLAFNIQPVKAIETIYIRPDGSIDPLTAPIHRDGDLYTLTGNITSDADGIVIERSNMTLDGAGHTLQGSGVWFSSGVSLSGRSNVTIKDLRVKGFIEGIRLYMASSSTIYGDNVANNKYGVTLEHSSNNNIRENNVTNNELWGVNLYESSNNNSIIGNNVADNWEDGISLDMSSSNNSIHGNSIADNGYGIRLWYSPDNSVFTNDLTNNKYGIYLRESSNNIFYHNNFVNNTQQILDYSWSYADTTISINAWDDGYPSGGNYWSDYNSTDLYGGPYQNETGTDGIGDTAYTIDDYNQDNYPLMNPWTPTPPVVIATLDIDPATLNLWSKGQWITAYIQLPEEYDAEDIDATTVLLNETISPVLDPKYGFATNPSEYLVDHNEDGILERMVKFDKAEVMALLSVGEATLTITGEVKGTPFEGSDSIRVVLPPIGCSGCRHSKR